MKKILIRVGVILIILQSMVQISPVRGDFEGI